MVFHMKRWKGSLLFLTNLDKPIKITYIFKTNFNNYQMGKAKAMAKMATLECLVYHQVSREASVVLLVQMAAHRREPGLVCQSILQQMILLLLVDTVKWESLVVRVVRDLCNLECNNMVRNWCNLIWITKVEMPLVKTSVSKMGVKLKSSKALAKCWSSKHMESMVWIEMPLTWGCHQIKSIRTSLLSSKRVPRLTVDLLSSTTNLWVKPVAKLVE